ncbi:MAG: class II aldolase/adducin family protein [Spirochaetales bacterium]|nr:class II aldolase/adducin family protein [Spirochaetales bacterium]
MTLEEARKTVIEAGHKLVQEGLVARTWGNISCRVDTNSFVITPSGRTYDELTEQDIVQVQIQDLAWEGSVKPSSEKGLHAEVYKLNDSCGAVIHTHQPNASAVAAARREIPLISDEMGSVIGKTIPCAGYGLPGTKKLKTASAAALKESGSKASLMANHGAVCWGSDMADAFLVATTLETVCAAFVEEEYKRISGDRDFTRDKMHDYYIDSIAGGRRK